MSGKLHHISRLPPVAARALASGGTLSPGKVVYPAAGNCQRPVYREMTYRRSLDVAGEIPDTTFRTTLEMEVRCRRCDPCLRARAAKWRHRAIVEIDAATRTWFGTLTLRPEEHYRCVLLADRVLRRGGERFEDLSADDQFRRRHEVVSAEITKWLKRVRKESGAPLRYCLVAEAHKNGLPHYHLLVHESAMDRPVTVRCLQNQWKLGFSAFKLADKQAAFYVTKYLMKAAMNRVRASTRYGSPPIGIIPRRGDVILDP